MEYHLCSCPSQPQPSKHARQAVFIGMLIAAASEDSSFLPAVRTFDHTVANDKSAVQLATRKPTPL
eukprot:32396-Amphidinium_carterae.1